MHYRLIFDATTVRYPVWPWLLPLALFAAFGLVLVRFPNLYGQRSRFMRAVGTLLTIVGLGSALFIWHVRTGQRHKVIGALRDGHYALVEGRVSGFRPGAPTSHPPEEFDVNGHHYRYAPAEELYSFNHVAGAGGPIHDGVQVRIADVDGLIARLEIAP